MCSITFLLLLSSYFWITYLICIHAYMLTPNSWFLLPVSGGWGLYRREEILQVYFGGTLPATSYQLPQPQHTPSLGHKPIWLQGCDTSPGYPGLRGTLLAFVFCCFLLNLIFMYVGVELIYQWCLFWVLSNPIHLYRHMYVSVTLYLWTLLI